MSDSPEAAVSGLASIDGASASIFAREVTAGGDDSSETRERGGGQGDVLASHAPDRALPPASNTKLLTTALALDALGPDYRFETRATSSGELSDGRLDGDLRLHGGGAPDLSPGDLAELAERVRESGVETVAGDLLFDRSLFGDDGLGPGWTWGDERHAYGARSDALSLAGNTVAVEVADPAATGEFQATLTPETDAVSVQCDVEPGEDDCSVYTDHDTGVVRVEGTLPSGSERSERAPVSNPGYHCALAFRDALADADVAVRGDVAERTGTEAEAETSPNGHSSTREWAVESAPISALARRTNVPSDNFVAEQLARAVGASHAGGTDDGDGGGRSGSWEAWNDLATDRLESLGVSTCRIRDGSGLSRYNLLTARGVVELLSWAADRPWRDTFFSSLPEPGEGTLESRLADVDGVRAKTGTLTGTCALSGIVERPDAPDVLFSVLLSGLTGDVESARERQDAFVRSLR
ncbi:D-alanyl-D-alanine carboxypeptidase/D-alanyl-D-alanine endopeptidase [Halorussus halophilus]|uniref:D-alanyl-D-alanine carboxypeptidase/D-alanyl-D-alanine endopeptidase n=1 Tax=Halorussus halophilus TaxID=2650975 RepID=UPI00178825B0|nr:D-alanyl-D-alanine carboxypeptidase/D-alanyl-D-alanine-endopeptidase [Halorussus halophilus]